MSLILIEALDSYFKTALKYSCELAKKKKNRKLHTKFMYIIFNNVFRYGEGFKDLRMVH